MGSDCVYNNLHSFPRGVIWVSENWMPEDNKFVEMFKKRGIVNYLILRSGQSKIPAECMSALFFELQLSDDVVDAILIIVRKYNIDVSNALVVSDDLSCLKVVLDAFPSVNTFDWNHAVNYICNEVGFSQLPVDLKGSIDFDFEKYQRLFASPYTRGDSMAMLRDSIDVPFARLELVKRLLNIGTTATLNEAFAICSSPDSQEIPEIKLLLARMYLDGIVVEPNVDFAYALVMELDYGEHPELCFTAVKILFLIGATDSYSAAVELCKTFFNRDKRLLIILADEYFTGKHVSRDITAAIDYYSRAVNAGIDKAFNGLADALLARQAKGDVNRAFEILNQRPDDPWSMMRLARMYRDGTGIEKNIDFAKSLFAKAADMGVDKAKDELIKLVITYNMDEGDVTKLAEDPEYIYQCAKRLASDPTKVDEAISEYLKIVDYKPAAVNECADLLVKRNRKGDSEKAFSMVKSASDSGNLWAQGRVARFYRDGIHVEADLDVAIGYMRIPAERGIKWAREEMVAMLLDRGEADDIREAFSLRQDGAYEEDGWSQIHLARMYRDGVGTDRDLGKAILLMRSASKKGISQAKVELRRLLTERGLPEDKIELKKSV